MEGGCVALDVLSGKFEAYKEVDGSELPQCARAYVQNCKDEAISSAQNIYKKKIEDIKTEFDKKGFNVYEIQSCKQPYAIVAFKKLFGSGPNGEGGERMEIHIAFRGTHFNWLNDWKVNFRWIWNYSKRFDAYVHSGYENRFNDILPHLNEIIDWELAKHKVQRKNAEFLVTGHSKGAALAELAAYHVAQRYKPVQHIELYTFASPGVFYSDAPTEQPVRMWSFYTYFDFVRVLPFMSLNCNDSEFVLGRGGNPFTAHFLTSYKEGMDHFTLFRPDSNADPSSMVNYQPGTEIGSNHEPPASPGGIALQV